MDWSTFVPTLLATLLGVIVSITLSLLVYWLRALLRNKRQKEETRQTLLQELDANMKLLQEHIDGFGALHEQGRELSLELLSRLRTSAYEAAFQAGRVRLLGDVTLQRDLASLVDEWRFFNVLVQRYEDTAIHVAVQLSQERAPKLLSRWDDLVLNHAQDCLNKTVEVRERLETTKWRHSA